jgi:hypothetical protein
MPPPDDRIISIVRPAPPAEVEFVDIEYFLDNKAPERKYYFADKYGNGFIPIGEGCGVAATGGVGKTQIEIQKVIALAGRVSFLDYSPAGKEPIHCFLYTAEDDVDELHRRVEATFRELTADMQDGEAFILRANLKKYLHIASLIGKEFMLTLEGAQDIQRAFTTGPAVEIIVDHVNTIGDGSGYVSIDPLRRVTVGQEDGQAFAAVIDALDRIRKESGGEVTTCVLHHTAKQTGKDGELGADIFRGAGDLTAGLRWAMGLALVNPDAVTKLTIDGEPVTKERALDLRRFALAKANYERRSGANYLEYQNGIFVPVTVVNAAAKEEKAFEENIAPLLEKMKQLGGPKSEGMIRPHAKAKGGAIPVSAANLPALLDLAVDGGYLKTKRGRKKGSTLFELTGKPFLTEAEAMRDSIKDYRAQSNGD